MSETCPKCGLPKELCVCEEIAKEEQKIVITLETKRYGKKMTAVKNLGDDIDLEDLASDLKKQMACGGTVKNGKILLQGTHTEKVKDYLTKQNFPEDQIEIK